MRSCNWLFPRFNFCLCFCRCPWRCTPCCPRICTQRGVVYCSVCCILCLVRAAWRGAAAGRGGPELAGRPGPGPRSPPKTAAGFAGGRRPGGAGPVQICGFCRRACQCPVPRAFAGIVPGAAPGHQLLSVHRHRLLRRCSRRAGHAGPQSLALLSCSWPFSATALRAPLCATASRPLVPRPYAAQRRVDADRFCYGIKRFVFGLSKKALIADQLALIYQRVVSVPASTVPAPMLVLGYVAYMLQLYFDFSGYSDMAIGVGTSSAWNCPRTSTIPTWPAPWANIGAAGIFRLSSWFRDYLYIPLGGSRCITAENLPQSGHCLYAHRPVARRRVAVRGVWPAARRTALCRAARAAGPFAKLPAALQHLYTVVVLWLTLIIFGAPGLDQGLGHWQASSPGRRAPPATPWPLLRTPNCC